MARLSAAVFTVATLFVTTVVFAPTALATAHVAPWRWTSVSTGESFGYAGQVKAITASCPSGYRPVSIEWSPGSDWGALWPFDRLGESFDFANNSASITMKSYDGPDGLGFAPTAGMTLNCVYGDDIGPISTVTANVTHYWGNVGGTVACPVNTVPLAGWANWSVTGTGERIDFSGPTATGWYSTGYRATAGASVNLGVACISSATAVGVHIVNSTVSSGSGALASCPAGEAVAGGGSYEAYNGAVDPARTNGQAQAESYISDKTGLEVLASGVGGAVTLSALAICVPVSVPTLTVTSAPHGVSNSTSISYTFSGSDPAGENLTYDCYLFGAGVSNSVPCVPNVANSVSSLADGSYELSIQATNGSRQKSPRINSTFQIDTVKPSATLTEPNKTFTKTTSTTTKWISSDAGSGVASFELRSRQAPFNGGFGAWSAPITFDADTTGNTFTGLTPGYDYCYAVDAVDAAGNTSPTSASRCTAVPLDDRSLVASAGWTQVSQAGYIGRTASRTTTVNATLTIAGAQLDRLALVAEKCPTCGAVTLSVDGVPMGTVDLNSATTARASFSLPKFSYRTGTVEVKVISSGKLVQIDGLGISRT